MMNNNVHHKASEDAKERAMANEQVKLTQDEIELLEQYRKHQEYMKAYNQRPEVKEKHREYNSKRWARIKQARELLKQEGIKI